VWSSFTAYWTPTHVTGRTACCLASSVTSTGCLQTMCVFTCCLLVIMICTQWRRNRGFRRFSEPGPRAPVVPPVRGKKNFMQEKNAPLGVGSLHRFPDPVASPHATKPHHRSHHFGLPVLAQPPCTFPHSNYNIPNCLHLGYCV